MAARCAKQLSVCAGSLRFLAPKGARNNRFTSQLLVRVFQLSFQLFYCPIRPCNVLEYSRFDKDDEIDLVGDLARFCSVFLSRSIDRLQGFTFHCVTIITENTQGLFSLHVQLMIIVNFSFRLLLSVLYAYLSLSLQLKMANMHRKNEYIR